MEEPWWELRERPFHSDKPLLGRLIVWFRTLWNNIATRWYVIPLIQQQTAINHRLHAEIAGLHAEIVGLHAEIADLREELSVEQELRRVLDDELVTTRRDQTAVLYAMQAEVENLQTSEQRPTEVSSI